MAASPMKNGDDKPETVPKKRYGVFGGKQNDAEMTDVDKLKLALWFIGKCGSVGNAERVFRAAVSASNELLKPESK